MADPANDPAPDLPSFVTDQRARAAYIIARGLATGAAEVMAALNTAVTREQADVARNRSIAFGVMVDQLAKLMGVSTGRYGNGRASAELDIDQLRVLASALPPPSES